MAIAIAHSVTCGGVNDPTKQVSKDAWNAAHPITQAGQRMLGKPTAGTGPVEEMDAAAVLAFAGGQAIAEKGQANGYAGLDGTGKVPSAQLPASGGSPFMFEGSLAADAATGANVTPISLTGLVFTFEANSRYWIEFQGATRAAATTTGSGFQLDLSAAVTRVGLGFTHVLANTGTVTAGSSIADDTSAGVSSGRASANVDTPVFGNGYLITGANTGTAQLRYRSEVAAVSTVMAGFMMRVRKLP
jgi:hypothetical protein